MNEMDGNNWQNKIYYSKERRFNNRRSHHPYAERRNINQEYLQTYPVNDNVQSLPYNSNRYNHGTFKGESNDFSRRENSYNDEDCFKTNVHQRKRLPYNKPRNQFNRNSTNRNYFDTQPSTSSQLAIIEMSPQEAKTLKLLNATQSQNGVSSSLVLLQSDGDNPATILQNAVHTIRNGVLTVVPGIKPQNYELKINGECITEGEYTNKQIAKNALCEIALEKLKKTCFYIVKKKNYEEISTEELNKPKTSTSTSTAMKGSKAHLMMLKMGWGGKGLGVNEQGAEKTVAETMTRNINKEGLGGKDILSEIKVILDEFARSTKITTLAFDSGFTKEERASIHQLAAQLNLKSKSEGKGENRRITIGKKMARWDLVKELLLVNCENETYKLFIPSDFESLWIDD